MEIGPDYVVGGTRTFWACCTSILIANVCAPTGTTVNVCDTYGVHAGAPAGEQGGAAVAVPGDRRAQAVGRGGGARRAERPPAGALRGPGALLGARQQAQPPR
jgi:hypothetical protein